MSLPGSDRGLSPLDAARQEAGISIAAQRFQASFFRNGATVSAVLEMPQGTTRQQAELLRDMWHEEHQGSEQAHKVGILPGASYKPMAITQEQAQFLESRDFSVLDIGTRRVIGWSLQPRLQAALVTSALDMALGSRSVTPGLICHSDRGSQYGSEDVQNMIARYHLRGSMSRKGNCWDNAVVESFFASLKTELVAEARWESRAEAKSAIVAWIEGWYNRERMHSTLGYLSPVEFELQIATNTT